MWTSDKLGPLRKQNRLLPELRLEPPPRVTQAKHFSLSASVFEFAWVTSRGVTPFSGEKQVLGKI